MSVVEELQQDYEQQFNDCCAKIVGLKAGSGCTDQIYFKDDGMHGTYECKIEDYVPYTSLDQLEPVVEVLKSTLGFAVDLEEKRRDGALVTYRSMIDEMLSAIDDCENHPYETLDGRVEDITRKLVNEYCAKTMGYTRGVLDVYFNEDGGVIDKISEYNPYDDVTKLVVVIDAMAGGLNLRPKSCTIASKGHREAWRELILDNIVSDEDILDVEEGWDEYDRLEITHPMYDDNLQEWIEENTKRQFEHSLRENIKFDNTKEDIVAAAQRVIESIDDQTYDTTTYEDIFNINCADFMAYETMYNNLGYGPGLVYAPTRDGWDNPEPYNPYDDFRLLKEVVDELLEDDDHPKNDTDKHFIAVAERTGVPPQEQMVLYRNIVADRLINDDDLRALNPNEMPPIDPRTDEERFQSLCIKIKTTFEVDGYCLDTSTFRPYINIQQLADIVEKVIAATFEPFVISIEGSGGNIDVMEEMRRYVQTYSTEQYLPKIYTKNKQEPIMKKLDDILKGFDLMDTWDDGTKEYDRKPMHSVLYDYFDVNGITVYPNGHIDANCGVNCDLFEGANDLDEFHVFKLTEIA